MAENSPASTAATRYYDIDWLRVFATIVVFLFHAAKRTVAKMFSISRPAWEMRVARFAW